MNFFYKGIIFVLFCFATIFGYYAVNADSFDLKEAQVVPSSSLSEINVFSDGQAYLVDDEADLLWRIDPVSGEFEMFFPIGIMDVMPDGGNIWLTDGASYFGYFDTIPAQVKLYMWQIPADGTGNRPDLGPIVIINHEIWMSTYFSTLFGLFHFIPDTRQLCHYGLTGGSFAADMVQKNNFLIILDWSNNRLIYFEMIDKTVIHYDLESYPINRNAHLLLDDDFLWWTDDQEDGSIYQLDTTSNQLFIYQLPIGKHPVDLTKLDGNIWFTDKSGSIGQMNVSDMTPAQDTLTPTNLTQRTSDCVTLNAPLTYNEYPVSGTLTWSSTTGQLSQPQAGISFIDLQEGSVPRGITTVGNSIWVTDEGVNNRIISLDQKEGYTIFLPLLMK